MRPIFLVSLLIIATSGGDTAHASSNSLMYTFSHGDAFPVSDWSHVIVDSPVSAAGTPVVVASVKAAHAVVFSVTGVGEGGGCWVAAAGAALGAAAGGMADEQAARVRAAARRGMASKGRLMMV